MRRRVPLWTRPRDAPARCHQATARVSEPAPKPSITPGPGMVLGGKYRVTRQIGKGGMGVVLAAEHTVSGKQVAIKWLHPSTAEQPDAEQRFVREARAAARVR